MPDLCRGRETNRVTRVLKTPDEIDVVAGGAELAVETVHFLGDLGVVRHVAAGHVLGGAVVDHDVGRSTGREADALGDP